MSASDFAQVIEEYHRTIDAIVTGDPEPQKRLWSRGDDVTLANPSAHLWWDGTGLSSIWKVPSRRSERASPSAMKASLSIRRRISATTSSLSGRGQSSAVKRDDASCTA